MVIVMGNIPQKPPLSELMHYGVKGMKWGVIRRERMEKSTQSRAERRAASKNYGEFAAKAVEKKYGLDNPLGLDRRTISADQYKKLSTKDYTLRKGTTVRRVTRRKDENYDQGVTYVSSTKKDQNVYRAVMPQMGRISFTGKRFANSYEVTLKATQQLKSPSEKARVDAFIQMMDTPSITLKNGKVITGREHLRKAGFRKEVRSLDATRLGLEFYNTMTEYQYNLKEPLNTAYFNRLRDKGYNAVMDDNDRGHLAEAPLILLNPNGSVKKMGVTKLTADDVNNAMRDIKH